MIWVRYRMDGGKICPVLSPMATCASLTLCKSGVMLLDSIGNIKFFFPNERVAEVVDDDMRYVQTTIIEQTLGGIKFPKLQWELLEPKRDGVGRIIG